MQRLIACLALLLSALAAPHISYAELHFSGNYQFNAFEHNQELCKQVVRSLKENTYPYQDMNISSDGNTIRFDDYKYHQRRCFDTGRRVICSGGKSYAYEVIEIACRSGGEVRIDYRRPRDESVYDEDCMVKNGNRYCNSDSYRDKPGSIKNDIEYAIEKQQHRGTYRVYIDVTPDDARIKITNIKPRYKYGMYLAPGRYDFEVSRPGYETQRFYIEHKADAETYSIELKEARARQEKVETWIGVFPDDARVEMLDSGETYQAGMALIPGKHRMRVSKPGFETKTFTVTVGTEGQASPQFLGLEMDVASKKKQCREQRQLVAEVASTGSYKGKKLDARDIARGTKQYNKQCVPLGFDPL